MSPLYWVGRLDARLLAISRRTQYLVLVSTIAAMCWQALPWVPRDVVDFSRLPLVHGVRQQSTYGTDTIADAYESKVVLHDVADMYTKRGVEQTPLEARTWSRPASAPYPPAALLIEAGLFALGGRTYAGFYLTIIGLAALFLGLSLFYCLQTRWYLFPLLYLNFSYIGQRFVGVQDCSYLVMLVVVMAALLLARARRPLAHPVMALAIAIKLSPLYYVTELVRMPRRAAVVFVAILFAGLVLPYFVWENYLYIYSYAATLKGQPSSRIGAILAAVPFAVLVAYVEARLGFDLEDRVGWGLVPFALYLAIRMNVARHLLLVLLVPDKRAWRNVAVALGLALYTVFRGALPLGSVLSIVSGLLFLILVGYLRANRSSRVRGAGTA